MTDEQQDAPKIIVDDDWKERVQAEKQAAQAREAAQSPAGESPAGESPAAQSPAAQSPAGESPNAAEERAELPPASFATLVHMFTSQALAALGQIPDPDGKRMVHLDLAKHIIDTLAVVETKTKGNLDTEEAGMLGQVLYELRMLYVHVHKEATAAQPSPDASGASATSESSGPKIVTD
jgi:hypothetical protein